MSAPSPASISTPVVLVALTSICAPLFRSYYGQWLKPDCSYGFRVPVPNSGGVTN